MRLVRVRLENFRSHADTEIDLCTVSAAAIVGVNGSGKSSIIESIRWCLFGGDPDGQVRTGERRCGVEVDLDIEGERWRISRGRDLGRKSWLVIEQAGNVVECHTIAA